jgi:hypothetical protein
MRRKRFTTIFLILIISSFLNLNKINALEEDFKKVDIRITNISWTIKDEEYKSDEEITVFRIVTEILIYNPNNESIILEYGVMPMQPFETGLSLILEDRKLDFDFICNCAGIFMITGNVTIPTGELNSGSISYLTIEKYGLTTLPDGRYLMWIFIYQYEESMANSIGALMIINNSIPSFDFNYSYTRLLNLPKNVIVLPLFLFAFVSIIKKRKNHSLLKMRY